METMTWVGLDVHARSTHAAALTLPTAELQRARFGAESEAIVAWLQRLPQPVHACYEAGPTGFVLYRTVRAAGIAIEVVAPTKTPRATGDRVKTDRKDAELLARLLPTGSLRPIAVPPPEVEGARDLARAREQLRVDLCRARHRVSKMLLRHGRVYPGKSTWTQAHHRWLAGQCFDNANSELTRGRRLRPFPLPAPACLLARTRPLAQPVRREQHAGSDHQDRLALRPSPARRGGLALRSPAANRRHAAPAPGRPARARAPDRLALPAPPLPPPPTPQPAAQARQHRHRRARPLACLLPLGGRRGPINTTQAAARGEGAGPRSCRHARFSYGPSHRATPAPREAHAGGEEQGLGVPNPRISD